MRICPKTGSELFSLDPYAGFSEQDKNRKFSFGEIARAYDVRGMELRRIFAKHGITPTVFGGKFIFKEFHHQLVTELIIRDQTRRSRKKWAIHIKDLK